MNDPLNHEQVPTSEHSYVEQRPVPDPTQLTTIAIAHEITAIREFILSELEGAKRVFQATIEGHWALDTERFRAVELRFSERDLRFTQAAVDNAEAIKSALAAVNSATTRLESTFGKQIESLAERITDLKDRITAIEGTRKGTENTIGWVIGASGIIMGVVIAVITGIFSLIHYSNGITH